jgi:hypothetical protein
LRATQALGRLLLLVALIPGCGGRSTSSSGPSAPAAPGQPMPVSPAAGAIVDSQTPTLVVRNASGFDAGQATYDFVVLAGAADTVIAQVASVPAGSSQTSAAVAQPLVRGVEYRWKAVAHASGRTSESTPTAFQIGVPCDLTSTDPWAKAVVDAFFTQCTLRTNRAIFLDPRNALGPPDARGGGQNGLENYSGIVSLGQNGFIVLDMGVCFEDRAGPEVRVFQYIDDEPVTVRVSGSAGGPWTLLGTKRCGDGGLPYNSNHCDFDLAGSGLKAGRYVMVEDAENFPCDQAGTRTEGADIDAVEVLNIRR